MNFMQKCKRNGGFTLVELIVVIAILAILAGVAVPAYTGYIKKAEEAADQQLIGAINTAFAAACLENGTDANEVKGVNTNKLDDDKTLPETFITAISVDGVTAVAADYNEAFVRYYAGNETSAFKTVESLVFVNGVFMDSATAAEKGEQVSIVYNGMAINVSAAAAQALTNSSFMNSGSASLLNKVDSVTQIATGMADGSLSVVFNSNGFKQAALNALGATPETYGTKTQAIIDQIKEKNPGMTDAEATAQMNANAAVLYAAQNAVNMSDSDISALFTATGSDTIKANLKNTNNTAEGMAQAALVYGMYTAYANSTEYGSDTLRANAENPIEVLNALKNDNNFLTYVNSAQGKTDMDAYMGALDMITDSASCSPDAVSDLMVNGFANDQLKGILAGLTGK